MQTISYDNFSTHGTKQKYKDKDKDKDGDTENTPPSWKQAGSVLLPMVNYSLGGDGGTTVIGVKNRASIWRSRLFSS